MEPRPLAELSFSGGSGNAALADAAGFVAEKRGADSALGVEGAKGGEEASSAESLWARCPTPPLEIPTTAAADASLAAVKPLLGGVSDKTEVDVSGKGGDFLGASLQVQPQNGRKRQWRRLRSIHVQDAPPLVVARKSGGSCRLNRWVLLVLFCMHSFFIGPHYLNWAPLRQAFVYLRVYAWECDETGGGAEQPPSVPPVVAPSKLQHPELQREVRGFERGADSSARGDGGEAKIKGRGDGACREQQVAIARLFTVCTAADFGFSFFAGVILDGLGPRAASSLGAFFMLLGWVMVCVSSRALQLYLPGIAIYGMGIDAAFYGVLTLPVLFPAHENLIMALLMGFRCAGWAAPLILERLVAPDGLGLPPKATLLACGGAALAASVCIAALAIPKRPWVRPSRSEEPLYHAPQRQTQAAALENSAAGAGLAKQSFCGAFPPETEGLALKEVALTAFPTTCQNTAPSASTVACLQQPLQDRHALALKQGEGEGRENKVEAAPQASAAAGAEASPAVAVGRSPECGLSLASLADSTVPSQHPSPSWPEGAARMPTETDFEDSLRAQLAAQAAVHHHQQRELAAASGGTAFPLQFSGAQLGGGCVSTKDAAEERASSWEERAGSPALSRTGGGDALEAAAAQLVSSFQQDKEQGSAGAPLRREEVGEEGGVQRCQRARSFVDAESSFRGGLASRLRGKLQTAVHLLRSETKSLAAFFREYGVSPAFWPLVPYFSLTLLRGVFFASSSEQLVPEALRLLHILLAVVFVVPPLLGLLTDLVGISKAMATVNTLGTLVVLLSLVGWHVTSPALSYVICCVFAAYSPVMSAQVYLYVMAVFPPSHMGKLLGLVMTIGGFFSLLDIPLFELCMYTPTLFPVVLALLVGLSVANFALISVLAHAKRCPLKPCGPSLAGAAEQIV